MREYIFWQPVYACVNQIIIREFTWGSKMGTYESGTKNNESSLAGAAVGCVHNPLANLLVEGRSHYHGMEGAVFLDIHNLIDMVKVSSDFLVIWVIRRPVPRIVYFGPGELILRHS